MIPGDRGRIVHFSPGRVRLRVARPHRTPDTFGQIEGFLATVPGVTGVEGNIGTGSVLIHYDPRVLDPSSLLEAGRALGLVAGEVGAGASGESDWRRQLNTTKLARSSAILVVAALGGMVAPALGVSARMGSFSAAAAIILLSRLARQARSGRSSRKGLREGR
jgi:hypothetical protein